MEKAVPCPSCGERPTVRTFGDDCYYAMCACIRSKQNKDKYSFLGMTAEKAIRNWNNYFQPTNQKGEKCQKNLTMRLQGLETRYGPSKVYAEKESALKKKSK